MGLAKWSADKIRRIGKNKQEEQVVSGVKPKMKTKSPYRDQPLMIEDLTREDLEMILTGLIDKGIVSGEDVKDRMVSGVKQEEKSQSLDHDVPLTIADLTREGLEMVMTGLIDKGIISGQFINEQAKKMIGDIRGDVRRQVENTAEVKGKLLSREQRETLFRTLKLRFDKHKKDKEFKIEREGIEWAKVWVKLEANPEKMWSLNEMERTGGEPDVVGYDEKTGEYIFFDCSKESSEGRRKVCFNRAGQKIAERRGRKPAGNAVDMAEAMGAKITTRSEYEELRGLVGFDRITLYWIVPDNMSEIEMRTARFALGTHWFAGEISVVRVDTDNIEDDRAFRCLLRV